MTRPDRLIPTAVRPLVGTRIEEAIDAACILADEEHARLALEFNDIRIEVTPRSDLSLPEIVGRRQALLDAYQAACDLKSRQYRRSLRGRWACLELAFRRWHMDRTISAEEKRGFRPFSLRDQALWDHRVAVEADDRLGMMLLRYAARWANYMERELRRGKTVLECAESTSHKADIEGMSGAAWNMVMNLLIAVWEHGPDLDAYKATTWVGTAERAKEA